MTRGEQIRELGGKRHWGWRCSTGGCLLAVLWEAKDGRYWLQRGAYRIREDDGWRTEPVAFIPWHEGEWVTTGCRKHGETYVARAEKHRLTLRKRLDE